MFNLFSKIRILSFTRNILFVLLCTMYMPLNTEAQELTGNEIVKRVDKVMIGDSAEWYTVMWIKRPGQPDKKFQYMTYFKERGSKVLVRILYPPEEVGKDLLLRGDDIWQYVTDVGKTIRVAGSQTFMGGDFNNYDLVRISLVNDYNATLINITKIKGENYYFLKLKAKRASAVYDSLNYWVKVDGFIPYKEEYITFSGKPIKSLVYSDVAMIGGRKRPRVLTMINSIRPKNRTIAVLVKAEFDKNLPDSMFTVVYLERKRR